ncbi:MAG: hypothetical protein L6R40_001556 [Gallowayella cf. fulva]|nr:MAG: hypothetical protein L6R40_001556 [Xanthomendoza cf. fulva]
MAVQAHNIPWTLLASKFKYTDTRSSYHGITNYYAKLKPHPGKDIAYFVSAFAQTVEEHSLCERRKYPDEYTKPDPNDLVISEDVSRKIGRTVHRYREANLDPKTRSCTIRYAETICSHRGPGSQCQCPVRYEDRIASMFTIAPARAENGGYCHEAFRGKYHEFEFTAMIKTLLLHGEMDVLLMLAAYNSERIARNWTMIFTNCQSSDQGWREVRDLALYPFVCLNVLYAIRMASGCDDPPEEQDYRKTKAYQVALVRCTGAKEFGCYLRESAFDPETFPHRQFFGVYRGQYRNDQYYGVSDTNIKMFYGKMPLEKFEQKNGSSNSHMPTLSDVDEVFLSLRESGLPSELVLEILERADYRWQRRSPHSDDPMHRDNRKELLKYLKFCWILLVRCDVLAKACGKRIDWAQDVSHCINNLFGVNDGTLRRVERDIEDRDLGPDLIKSPDSWITWLSA